MKTTDQRTNELLEAALRYARAGYAVLPIHSVLENGICRCHAGVNCDKPGKHPATKHGVKDATTDESMICQFWQSNPVANVGIATGGEFGIVIDIDPRHGGDKSITDFESKFGCLPSTVTANTGGGGLHHIFKCPGLALKNRSVMPGVDIRVEGGYIVAPPSLHASGVKYEWQPDKAPGAILTADVPSPLLEILTDRTDRTQERVVSNDSIPEGQRNDTLFRLAAKLKHAGLSEEAIYAAVSQENGQRCNPPLSETEIKSISKSAAKYDSSSVEWVEPFPIQNPESFVPKLQESMLPPVLSSWVFDIADRMQTPPELIAVPVIVSLSSLIGNAVLVRPKAHDNWKEAPNLWGAVIAPPGSLKSPAMSEALGPIQALQKEAMKDFTEKMKGFCAEEEAYKIRIENLKKEGKKGKDVTQKILEENNQIEAKRPLLTRYLVNDATVEKLGEILRDNSIGVLSYRDELYGFLVSLDKKGHENDRSFYLEGWAGKNPYDFDRIQRGLVHLDKVCLSVLGGIQPDRLSKYFSSVLSGGSGDDGFLSRFQILVWPSFAKSWNLVDRKPNAELQSQIEQVYRKILNWRKGDGFSKDGVELGFSPEAQSLFYVWLEKLEKRLRSGEITTPALQAHLGKFRSLMPCLALIFHLVNVAAGSTDGEDIPLWAAEMAIEWCDFLEAHAKKIYAAAINPQGIATEELSKKIKSGQIFDRMPVRDVYRKKWSGLTTSEQVQGGLAVLIQNNWVRVETVRDHHATGGAPSSIIRINPKLRAFLDSNADRSSR